LGELVTAFTDAQFSQKQEYEANEYGFEFSVKHGFSPYAMGNSLNKLVELSKGAKASTVQNDVFIAPRQRETRRPDEREGRRTRGCATTVKVIPK